MRFLTLALAFVLTPSALQAQSLAPAAPESSQPEAPKEKLVCRRDDGVGSRLGKKICKTRAQWEEARKGEARSSKSSDREEE